MKLIVGLGNPGLLYANSRHNIGFSVIRALGKFYKAALKKDSATFSLSAKIKIKNQAVLLAMPLTFMNLSGLAVVTLLRKYRIDPNNLLVVCDDLDLELGRIKIRPAGSCGGHRGLESIIDSLGSEKLSRLRIGIGRPPHQLVSKNVGKVNWSRGRPAAHMDAVRYVLSPFSKREKDAVKEAVNKAVSCCQMWVSEGLAGSMNTFNQRRF